MAEIEHQTVDKEVPKKTTKQATFYIRPKGSKRSKKVSFCVGGVGCDSCRLT